MKHYQDLDNDQRRNYLDSTQMFEALAAAVRENRQYRGGMSWQTVNGKEYLVRVFDNRTKKSVGPRSPQTEDVFFRFQQLNEFFALDRFDPKKSRNAPPFRAGRDSVRG